MSIDDFLQPKKPTRSPFATVLIVVAIMAALGVGAWALYGPAPVRSDSDSKPAPPYDPTLVEEAAQTGKPLKPELAPRPVSPAKGSSSGQPSSSGQSSSTSQSSSSSQTIASGQVSQSGQGAGHVRNTKGGSAATTVAQASDVSPAESPNEPAPVPVRAPQAAPVVLPSASFAGVLPAPADPNMYDAKNTDVVPPTLLTPLSHVPLPPEIRREAASTKVAILVLVNVEGTVDSVNSTMEPRTLGESILVYNGLSIAKTWRFHPATRGGRPVRYRLRVPLSMF
jgi:hypothetical protein